MIPVEYIQIIGWALEQDINKCSIKYDACDYVLEYLFIINDKLAISAYEGNEILTFRFYEISNKWFSRRYKFLFDIDYNSTHPDNKLYLDSLNKKFKKVLDNENKIIAKEHSNKIEKFLRRLYS